MPYEIVTSSDSDANEHSSLFKVIIIGDSAVGKSCLMHRVTQNEFIMDHEVTVGVEFGSLMIRLEEQLFKLQIWDTAGQESFKSITKIFYKGAHCVLLAYDITRRSTFDNLQTWHAEVVQQSEPDVIMILVGNMKDREQHREVQVQEARAFQQQNKIPFFIETSAKSGQNVETVFQMAAKILYEDFRDRIQEMVSQCLAAQLQQLTYSFRLYSASKIIERNG